MKFHKRDDSMVSLEGIRSVRIHSAGGVLASPIYYGMVTYDNGTSVEVSLGQAKEIIEHFKGSTITTE